MSIFAAAQNRAESRATGNGSFNILDKTRFLSLFGGGSTKSGVNVTADGADRFSPIWNDLTLYGQSIGQLSLKVYRKVEGGREELSDHSAYRLLRWRANAFMSAYDFKKYMMRMVLGWGDAIAFIDRDGNERPKGLFPVHPATVTIKFQNGLKYRVRTSDTVLPDRMRNTYIDYTDVLHIKSPVLTNDGLTGKSVIRSGADNIGLGLAAEENASQFFSNGLRTHGVLQNPEELSDDAYKRLRESFQEIWAGTGNAYKTPLLEEGTEYKELNINPKDAQMLESRKFSVRDVSRWFNLPPHMLKDMEDATYSNIEQEALNFIMYSMQPWLVNFEQEYRYKLLSEREKQRNDTYFEHNVDSLQRADLKTRSDAYATQIQNGVMTPNEARRKENRNDKEGGDNLYAQKQYRPLDKIDNETPQDDE